MNIERFFAQEFNFDLAMKPWSWQHGVFVIIAVSFIYLTLHFAQAIKQSKHEQKIKYILVFWILLLELLYHLHYWIHGEFSIPFHMCSISAFLSVYVLLTDSKKGFQMLFLIGITGGFVALVLPDTLGYPYYNIRYYLYPLMHINILIVPIYYYKAYGYRLIKINIYKTFFFILALSPLAAYFNNVYDRNYLFTNSKPRIFASILPGWPYYYIIGIVGLFIFFHILYYIQSKELSFFLQKLPISKKNSEG